jgi:hypothetical protein
MSTLKKILLLSLALVLSFGLVAFAGCGSLPQEEIDSIIDGALNADYDTVSFEMTMPMTAEVKGGESPGTMTSDMSGNGVFDVVNQAMWMDMSVDMEIQDVGSQEITAEAYVLDGWMYVGVEIPDVGMQWMKMAMTEEIWQQQNGVDTYLELMATAVEVKYKGDETVNGVACYVFEIEPDMGVLSDLLVTQTSSVGMGMVDLSGFDIGELYKELSVKEWVAKDSYLLQRVEIDMVMEMSPVEAGYSGGDFDKMTMDIGIVMRFFDYDQPVTVILPPEALEAEDVASLYGEL